MARAVAERLLVVSLWSLVPIACQPQVTAQRSPPSWHIAEEPSLVIGTIDGPAETVLMNPVDATVLSDGTVVIGMFAPHFFALRYFNKRGEFLGEAGRYGDGPFEQSRGFTSLVRLPGDSLLVVGVDSRFHVFGPRGERVASGRFHLPVLSSPVAHLGPGQIVFQRITSAAPIRDGVGDLHSEVLLYDRAGDQPSTIDTYVVGRQKLRSGYSVRLPFQPYDYLSAGPSGLWRVSSRTGSIQTIGHQPHQPIVVELPHAARSVTDRMRKRWIEEQLKATTGAEHSRQIEGHLREVEFPEVMPQVQALDVDEDGNVWALRYEPSWSEDPYHWDIFGPDGSWIAEASAPFAVFGARLRRESFSLVKQLLEVGRDYILVRTRDQLGVARIERFSVSR